MCVFHSCKNNHCVNPKHLFIETKSYALVGKAGYPKGKYVGEKSPANIISEKDAVEIIKLYDNENYSTKDLSGKFNISKKQIVNILKGYSWSHLDVKSKKFSKVRHLTIVEVKEIKKLFKENKYSTKELAIKYKVSSHTISDIKNGKSYKKV